MVGIPLGRVRRNSGWTPPQFFGGGVGPTTTTHSNILHAPMHDSETKISRITVNEKVVTNSYDDVQNDFRPFLFDSFVSSTESDNKTPILILRDTCSSKRTEMI